MNQSPSEAISIVVYVSTEGRHPRSACRLTADAAREFQASSSDVALLIVDCSTHPQDCMAGAVHSYPTTRLLQEGEELGRTGQTFFTSAQLAHWIQQELRATGPIRTSSAA